MKRVLRLFAKLIKKTQGDDVTEQMKNSGYILYEQTPIGIRIGYCVRPGDDRVLGSECFCGKQLEASEKISGDTVTWCTLPDDKRALVLSDGMGKGREAALCSQKTVIKLKRVLKDGASPQHALQCTNDFIIKLKIKQVLREDDFATIDLAIIDKKRRKVSFYKMGAAASFLVRGGNVLKIHNSTLPAGIVQDVEITPFTTKIKPGDMIVMISDGVSEADRRDFEGRWLTYFLAAMGENVNEGSEWRPRVVASQILDTAAERNRGHEEDDMTAMIAIIKEENNSQNLYK